MEHLFEVGTFAAKAAVIVVSLIIIFGVIAANALKSRHTEELDVELINERYKSFKKILSAYTLEKHLLKAARKSLKKEEKKKQKKSKKSGEEKKRIFVLEFIGDIKAHAVDHFRDEVTAILSVAEKGDEVVVLIESPGGMVHTYGLAASQLRRIRSAGLKLTTAVDKVAASGGYLMACTGDQIIAAPFAVVGSIGVLAQVPNFHRLLKKHDVDYQEFTSGEYKRTISTMGEITEKGKKKFTEQIEDTHALFREFVKENRPSLDMEKVATGEPWFGSRAIELKLVDRICTSDEYLFEKHEDAKIIKISYEGKKKILEKMSDAMGKALSSAGERLLERVQTPPRV